MSIAAASPGDPLLSVGTKESSFPVELSTRFLEHFSEQLYSSPQKAFEELISNGWDAGATYVDVRVPAILSAPGAVLSMFDNGCSMDADGLRDLWHIAFSPKEGQSTEFGRPLIGRFGIGKLATYVLANKLTYICKAKDGRIRRVTMDYGNIDSASSTTKLISDITLDIFELTAQDVEKLLVQLGVSPGLPEMLRLARQAALAPSEDDEFGGFPVQLQPPGTDTWTLVLLSDLKQAGRELKVGILRRMLQAALPFGSEMTIALNGERLTSSKTDIPLLFDWQIGPDLGISDFELAQPQNAEVDATETGGDIAKASTELIHVSSFATPIPYVDVPGLGKVTGRIRVFAQRISGGKSDEQGVSHGFHVNVLGRVVNQSDPSFGEANLSHAVWARFRMAVRIDGLNSLLTTDREKFRASRELLLARAFLRKVFNKARTQYDSDALVQLADGGDVLVKALGIVSLAPLRNVVADTLRDKAPLLGLFDESGILDRSAKHDEWTKQTGEDISTALNHVSFERLEEDVLSTFRLRDNSIVVNNNHPFVAEHSRTRAEKELLRTIAMIDLLSDVYALDIGINASDLASVRQYRDRLLRFKALQRRQSGLHIAQLLLSTQHDSSNSKRMEAVVSDALWYLGYQVRDLAKSGEPEGIASAYPTPTAVLPTMTHPTPPLYSFSFDAKSSKHETAATGNIRLDAVVEHRNRYDADYALVIAPGFSDGALATRCAEQKVTPISARDLGRLLEVTVEYGAIPLTKLEELFKLYSPQGVADWVAKLPGWLKGKRVLTIDIFLRALSELKGKIPDVLTASTLAYICREKLGASTVRNEDIISVAQGMAILVPDLVGIEGDKIVVNASANHVASAVQVQLDQLHSSLGGSRSGTQE